MATADCRAAFWARILNGPDRLHWPDGYARFREAFADAIDPRFHTIEELDARIVHGDARFWSNATAAIVTEVKTFGTGARVVHGLVAAGELEGIKALIRAAEGWSKAQGHLGALIESRSGWARALAGEGYQIFQTSIFKEY